MSNFDNEAKALAPLPNPTPLISRTNVLTLGAIMVALMIVGSIFDLRISESLFNPESIFGNFFAAYGEWPAAFALVISGLLLIIFRNQERKARGIGQVIGGVWLVLSGAAMAMLFPIMYLDINPIIVAVIGLLPVGLVSHIAVDLSRGVDRRIAIRVALVLLIVVFAEIIVVNLIKIGWALSRVFVGAHFVSDTVVGCAVTLVVILVAYRIAFPVSAAVPASSERKTV